MLKWIAPIQDRLRHLQRPRMFSERGHQEADSDQVGTGQILAERVAGGMGSWGFIGAQAGAMVIWVLINTLALFHAIRFDAFPFVFLNLAMSAEAAFAAPVLLIAANVGATRDHAQANRIEKLTNQNETLGEQSEKLVDRMYELERLVDEHIAASAKAHSAEIADLAEVLHSIHATVSSLASNGNGSVATSPAPSGAAVIPAASVAPAAVAEATAPAAPSSTVPAPAPRSPSKRRRDNSNNSRS